MQTPLPPGFAEITLRLVALALYLGASLLYLRPLVAEASPHGGWLGRAHALGALAVHTAILGLFWQRIGRPPLNDLAEAMLVCSWLIALAFLVVERVVRQPVLGGFMLPVATILYALGLTGPSTAVPAGTPLAKPWLAVHVTAFVIAYAAFSIAFCTGLMYLLLAREIRRKRLSRFFLRLPSLEVLDTVSYRAVWAGFPFVALGLLSGVVWGGTKSHQWWQWEPTEVAAVITGILYFAYLLARHRRGWRGERAALLAIVGFALSVFTLLGGSLLIPGRHVF